MNPIKAYLVTLNPQPNAAPHKGDRWVGFVAIASAFALAVLMITGSLPA